MPTVGVTHSANRGSPCTSPNTINIPISLKLDLAEYGGFTESLTKGGHTTLMTIIFGIALWLAKTAPLRSI